VTPGIKRGDVTYAESSNLGAAITRLDHPDRLRAEMDIRITRPDIRRPKGNGAQI
jgi:hypothetical protein